MTHPSISAARDFVRDADLPEPPPLDFNVAKAPGFDFDSAREQATVVGSEVIAFVKGVTREQRQDIVNASLLAQLIARKQVAEPRTLADVKTWYDDYFDVLSNIGFVLQHRDFTQYREHSENFEAREAILEVAAALLAGSPGALSLVKTTLEALQFRRNEVMLDHHSGKVTINAPVLTAVRSQIAGRLVAYSTDYIQGLPPL